MKRKVVFCIYVGKGAAANFRTGLKALTWGFNSPHKCKGIRTGDRVIFVHAMTAYKPAPAGYPRVGSPEEFGGTARQVVEAEVVRGTYKDSTKIWTDDVYLHRFDFRVLSARNNVTFDVATFPRDVVDEVRRSSAKAGQAFPARLGTDARLLRPTASERSSATRAPALRQEVPTAPTSSAAHSSTRSQRPSQRDTRATSRHEEVIFVKAGELDGLAQMQLRGHRSRKLTFSCNPKKDIWYFSTYGYTENDERISISTELLRKVVAAYLAVRPRGGRFFLWRDGAYHSSHGEERRFVSFEIEGRVRFLEPNPKRPAPSSYGGSSNHRSDGARPPEKNAVPALQPPSGGHRPEPHSDLWDTLLGLVLIASIVLILGQCFV